MWEQLEFYFYLLPFTWDYHSLLWECICFWWVARLTTLHKGIEDSGPFFSDDHSIWPLTDEHDSVWEQMPEPIRKGIVSGLWPVIWVGLLVGLVNSIVHGFTFFFSAVIVFLLLYLIAFRLSVFSRQVFIAGALVSVLFLPSCAQLPDYARPKFYTHPETENVGAPGFRYRDLMIEDFEAKSLPPDYQQYHTSINARSCLSVRPARSTNAQISTVSYYGNLLYVGNFTDVSFEALFIPSCSWWNQNISQEKIDYVLQHEQIHFAISELTARKVTRELNIKMMDYTAVGGTHAEVKEELMKVLLDSAHEMLESDLEIHTDFDEDTSIFFDQDEQNSWFNQIGKQLNVETASR